MIVHVCKSIIKPVFYISLSSITTTVRQDNTATTTPHSRRILQLTVKGEWNMTNNKFCAYFSNLTQLLLSLNLNESSILCLYAYIHLFTTALNCAGLHSAVTQLPPAVVPQSLAPQLLLLVCLNILSQSIG